MDEKLQLSELRALIAAFIDDTLDLKDDQLRERIATLEEDANAVGDNQNVPGDTQNHSKVTARKRPLSFNQMLSIKLKETSVRKQTGRVMEIASFKPIKRN